MKRKALAACLAFAGLAGHAMAADIGEEAKGKPAFSANATSRIDEAEDQYYWLNKINRASSVMLVEEKIVSREMGRKLARGVVHAIEQTEKPGGKPPGAAVLRIEKHMTDAIGEDASFIHTGRSRQDMYQAHRMAQLRNQVLDFADTLLALRARLLAIAAKNVNTFIPAYTNGVQAQPISYADYLIAYEGSFARDAERIRELYKRMNRSAMGAGVLANSIWPLNRARMAQLLGFDGIIENSLDATQVAPSDTALEAAAIAASSAIRIGMVLNDIHTQYHQTRPWLLLGEGATYTSSAMPQKRNPGVIMRAREEASDVVGLAEAVFIRGHNVTTGMTDYKEPAANLRLFPHAVRMVNDMNVVLDALTINPQRALEELEEDWTTSMELAETLQKEHGIPFRAGHEFASDVVTYARANGLKPKTFPYAKAQDFYAQAIAKHKLADPTLPLSETRFRDVLSPAEMVKTRVGIGGPQPREVERMLGEAQSRYASDQAWMARTRQKLREADARLDADFRKLLAE